MRRILRIRNMSGSHVIGSLPIPELKVSLLLLTTKKNEMFDLHEWMLGS